MSTPKQNAIKKKWHKAAAAAAASNNKYNLNALEKKQFENEKRVQCNHHRPNLVFEPN